MNIITYTKQQLRCGLHLLAIIEFRCTTKWISLCMLNIYGQRYPVTLLFGKLGWFEHYLPPCWQSKNLKGYIFGRLLGIRNFNPYKIPAIYMVYVHTTVPHTQTHMYSYWPCPWRACAYGFSCWHPLPPHEMPAAVTAPRCLLCVLPWHERHSPDSPRVPPHSGQPAYRQQFAAMYSGCKFFIGLANCS